MKKLLIVAGTRPEIIKLAPVLLEARSRRNVDARFCATGQHAEMADEAMKLFGVRADTNLRIMRENQSLSDVSSAMFDRFPSEVRSYQPDVIVVQGDTTSAMTAAVAGFDMKVAVAHVEAGLRSGDMNAPFPEEANRRVISVVSRYNFCPTAAAKDALLREGHDPSRIWVTGNTVIDALEILKERGNAETPASVNVSIRQPYVLVTAHRRESFGAGLEHIAAALVSAARRLPDLQFVYPVHSNPNVRATMEARLQGIGNILLLPPVSYRELLTLLRSCMFVLTDSGGIQEEAPSFGKFCVVMRNVTERREGIEAGFAVLTGDDPHRIEDEIVRCWHAKGSNVRGPNPYGDGHAARRILDILERA